MDLFDETTDFSISQTQRQRVALLQDCFVTGRHFRTHDSGYQEPDWEKWVEFYFSKTHTRTKRHDCPMLRMMDEDRDPVINPHAVARQVYGILVGSFGIDQDRVELKGLSVDDDDNLPPSCIAETISRDLELNYTVCIVDNVVVDPIMWWVHGLKEGDCHFFDPGNYGVFDLGRPYDCEQNRYGDLDTDWDTIILGDRNQSRLIEFYMLNKPTFDGFSLVGAALNWLHDNEARLGE